MESQSTIQVPHTSDHLLVDDFTNSEWNRAALVTIDHYYSGEAAPASRRAEAAILWSDAALHLRYVCNQAEPLVVAESFQVETKTMSLWDRDVCEIFIAPNPAAVEQYFEFEAAPTGEWLDVAIKWTPEKHDADWNFKSGMSAAGEIEEGKVIVGIQIPWGASIGQPRSGERWRVNLFRSGGKDPDRGYLAWQLTLDSKPTFHVPQAFGSLVFI